MTWLVLGFVLYMNGEAEFFTSKDFYPGFEKCDDFAQHWATDKSEQSDVKEVWGQCVDIGDLLKRSSI